MTAGPRRVAIVPHTHWDREWYAPFQTFRMRLVDLLDELLPGLDADPSYAHFMLDGQMAVVDDYLAIRPEAEPTLRRLASTGRLSVGPWYILMDEFLVSGETIVRNLQTGLARGSDFGGAMEVGYLPDMFGHIAQMPQVLRQFGFEHAVVWRGVPAAVDRTAFYWRAPDGSTVRAEYLPQGYGNGAIVPDDARALVQRIDEWASVFGHLLDGASILWMNGTDHLMPQPWLGRVVTEANAVQADYRLTVTSLAAYLAGAPEADLPQWEGELRSGARANLLMGVASNRVDVKQAAARAERALERLAEPLGALFLPPAAWPTALLQTAWLEMIRNSAHDSICACSHDDVGRAVLHRYAEATAIAEGIASRALAGLAATAGAGPVVVNPSARTRNGSVEIWSPGPVDPGTDGVQVLETQPSSEARPFDSMAMAVMAVREMEYQPDVLGAVIGDEHGSELARVERTAFGELVTGAVWRRLSDLATRRPVGPVVVTVTRPYRTRVMARVEELPGYGWRSWRPGGRSVDPVVAGGDRRLSNGRVTLDVDPVDGTFAIGDHRGLGRLVDGGDVGDTYNWCPPAEDTIVDRPSAGTFRVVESGPVRGVIELTASYRWPNRVAGSRREGGRDVEIVTRLELHAGEELVRVQTTVDNRCRDHRLRAWFPLPEPATESRAECAFAVVARGLTAEGGATEAPLPTFPSRRFVQAGGLTVVHEGLLEYELVDVREGRAHALALTMLRATGLLSQGPMATRPLPAGPVVAAEAAQLQQLVTLRYAVALGEVDPYAMVDDAFLPLLSIDGSGGDGSAVEGRALAVDGAEVSALRRTVDGALEVRVFNPTSEPVTVTVGDRSGWLVDLRSNRLDRFTTTFPLGPWRIATAVLD